jgi:hypothetical protein
MEKIEYVVTEDIYGLTGRPGRKEIGRFTNLEDAKKLMESEFLELVDRARNESKEKTSYRNNEFNYYSVYITEIGDWLPCTIDSRHTPLFRYGQEVK